MSQDGLRKSGAAHLGTKETILTKQTAWAKSRGIELVGSKGEQGARVYTPTLEDNLFLPMSSSTLEQFMQGDGSELGTSDTPGKMQALHSSSALGVNVFEYWKQNGDTPMIAVACGLVRSDSKAPKEIVFEEKYPISEERSFSPNIDVAIHNGDGSAVKCLAIECKFTEAYSSYGHSGLKDFYLEKCSELWSDIPELKTLAETITPDDNRFKYLHAAQLIKHILGLKRQFDKRDFRLLYLWYDALGEPGASHRREIDEFSRIAKDDGIWFRSITYQELIVRMKNTLSSEHDVYVQYLASRYI